jgi:hypothetical protein
MVFYGGLWCSMVIDGVTMVLHGVIVVLHGVIMMFYGDIWWYMVLYGNVVLYRVILCYMVS